MEEDKKNSSVHLTDVQRMQLDVLKERLTEIERELFDLHKEALPIIEKMEEKKILQRIINIEN